jgi:hypothetical protein
MRNLAINVCMKKFFIGIIIYNIPIIKILQFYCFVEKNYLDDWVSTPRAIIKVLAFTDNDMINAMYVCWVWNLALPCSNAHREKCHKSATCPSVIFQKFKINLFLKIKFKFKKKIMISNVIYSLGCLFSPLNEADWWCAKCIKNTHKPAMCLIYLRKETINKNRILNYNKRFNWNLLMSTRRWI